MVGISIPTIYHEIWYVNVNRLFESKFMSIINKIADIVVLSILWTVSSIPIITANLATSAAFHTYQLTIVNGERHVPHVYWNSIKQNWKQAVPVGVIMTAVQIISIMVLRSIIISDEMSAVAPMIMATFFLTVVLCFQLYFFPLIGHYNLSFIQANYLVSRCLIFHPLKSICLLGIFCLLTFCTLYYPPLILITPGAYFFFTSKLYCNLFFRYINTKTDECDSTSSIVK